MAEIKSAAVLGAGAVGSYVIWGLSQKENIRLGVIADGERAERLKINGCRIDQKIYRPEVWNAQEAHGVDSEERIGEKIGASHVLPALIKVASRRTADGCQFDPETTIGIVFGEPAEPFESERVQVVKDLFADTGIHFRVTEHIQEEIWSKFRLNVCNNLPQAILGAGVGCYQDSIHMQAIRDGLRAELEAIAAAKWKQLYNCPDRGKECEKQRKSI